MEVLCHGFFTCPFVVLGKYIFQIHKSSIFHNVPTLHIHSLFLTPELKLITKDGKNQGVTRGNVKSVALKKTTEGKQGKEMCDFQQSLIGQTNLSPSLISKSPVNHEDHLSCLLPLAPPRHPAGPLLAQIPPLNGSWRVQGGSRWSQRSLCQRHQRG